ncbi:MAG: hypothetical protein Q9181_002654 [Wetmoreana brouardii]
MTKHSEIPRHCGIKTRINHNYPLDLAQRGAYIAMETTPWRRQDTVSNKRATFLNNFSAAGGNTAILLEDAPVRHPIAGKASRSVHIATMTAKSPKSLIANIDFLISFLEKASTVSLAALSYTTTARRIHHNYRVVVSGSDILTILSALKSRIKESQVTLADMKPTPTTANKQPRVVFAFSGQNTLYAELGKSLFVTNAKFHARILRLNHPVKVQNFPLFLSLVDGSTTIADLTAVGAVVTQLALVCVQIALFGLWRSWNVTPAAVIGHSLVECAMLYAAGVLSVADVIYLVGTRAAFLEARYISRTHAILAIKAVEPCDLWAQDKILEVAGATADKGIEAFCLNAPFTLHSAQFDPILAESEHAAAQGVTYHPTTVPVLSPLLAQLIPAGDSDTLNASYLAAACRGKVDFTGALAAA